MRPTVDSLISDYMLDLAADIKCAEELGQNDQYTRQCRERLAKLEAAQANGTPVSVDRYGMPIIEEREPCAP